jgi:hypothetical protein
MKTIAARDTHDYRIDETINRGYATYQGKAWTSVMDVPDAVEDFALLCRSLAPGYTLLADFSQLSATGQPDLFDKAHELMMSTGVGRVAVVHSGQNFLKSQLSSLSKKWKLPVRSFTDRTEAESWLNQV